MNNEQLTFTIQSIAAAQTYALRHAVLWPNKPPAYVRLPDDDAGQHFGALVAGEPRAVISLFVTPAGETRFRKFATDPTRPGRVRAWARRCCGTPCRRRGCRVPARFGAMPAKIRCRFMPVSAWCPGATFFTKATFHICVCAAR